MTPSDSEQTTPSYADSAGMFASIACAIHCAAMPLVIGYLPMLGLTWLADESFHKVMAAICFALAVSAFWPGWRRHGSLVPAGVGLAGVLLLAVAAFGLEGHCCASCAAASDATPPEPTCTDEQCPHCRAAEQESVATEEVSVTDQAPSVGIASWAIGLITPLGGLFLVAGHLVNHRKTCLCGSDRCCHSTTNGGHNSCWFP